MQTYRTQVVVAAVVAEHQGSMASSLALTQAAGDQAAAVAAGATQKAARVAAAGRD